MTNPFSQPSNRAQRPAPVPKSQPRMSKTATGPNGEPVEAWLADLAQIISGILFEQLAPIERRLDALEATSELDELDQMAAAHRAGLEAKGLY